MNETIENNRREVKDRRRSPTNPLSWSSFRGRRRRIRRDQDLKRHIYVDRYSHADLAAVVATLGLSVLDAIFTIYLTGHGAKEVNPVMEFYLGLGPFPFLLIKYVLTAGCLVFVLVHKNYHTLGGRLPVRILLFLVPVLYAILVAYELFLIRLL